MAKIVVDPPLPPEIASRSTDLAQRAPSITSHVDALQIRTEEDYHLAGEYLTTIVQPALNEAEEIFRPSISDANALHKRLLGAMRKVQAPWQAAKELLQTKRAQYRHRVEEEQRRRDAELRAEMQRNAEAVAREEAQRLYEQGREEEGDAVVDALAAGEVKPVVEVPEMIVRTPKSEGVAVRRLLRFRVTKLAEIKREYLIPDTAAIQKAVNTHGKAAAEVVGGIEVYEVESEAVRAR